MLLALLMLPVVLTGCPKRQEIAEMGPKQMARAAPMEEVAPAKAEAAPEVANAQAAGPIPPSAGQAPEAEVAMAPGPSEGSASAAPTLKDIFFDFDQALIREDTRKTLAENVAWLKAHPQTKVTIEGHGDERGTAEYNVALGDRRARATKDFLVAAGIAADRLSTISFGKERPFVLGHDESAWKWNRRTHFAEVAMSDGPGAVRMPETAPRAAEKSYAYARSAPEASHAVVRVFYATDRGQTSSSKPAEVYGTDRAEVTYGTCEVGIPRDHRMGELESPSIWRLEFRQDPEKHVVLLNVSAQGRDKYFSELGARIRASSKKKALIFVHGYNVTFEDAARRTAQISYDLGFDGAPVFYSWPSQGTVAGYPVDETNIEWSQTNLRRFLDDFVARTDAEHIYLIAHSMGNRALTRAFGSLMAERPTLRERFRELILTAPDIDAEVFKRDIAPQIIGTKPSVTLYASSEDNALRVSKAFHGYPRAGDAGFGLVVVPGIETVDATDVDTSFLGHSYFAETRSVLADMFYLIGDGKRADHRFALRPIEASAGRYWVFKK